jgi:hypothetical protein
MKDFILPIAIVLGTAVLISTSYSSIEVKGRPSAGCLQRRVLRRLCGG